MAKIGKVSKIVQEDQKVLATVGGFEIQRARGQIGIDTGGVFFREYIIPAPAAHAHAEANALLHREPRRVAVHDLTRLDSLDITLAKLKSYWDTMMVTSNSITILPMEHVELSQEGRVVFEDKSAPTSPWALMALSQHTLPCMTAAREIETTAVTVLERFIHDVPATLDYIAYDGTKTQIEAPLDFCLSPVEGKESAIARIADVMQARITGTDMHERINSKAAEVLFAIQRVRAYSTAFERMVRLRQAGTDPAERFFMMKLFTEALTDLAGVLDEKIVFTAPEMARVRQFSTLQQNLKAAAIVDATLTDFFGFMPHANWVRTASSKDKWTLSGWPEYGRQMYAMAGSQAPHGIDFDQLGIAGDEFDVMLPVGLGDRDNVGNYRTTRSLDELCLRIKLPVIPMTEADGVVKRFEHVFDDVVHLMYDTLSPYNYQGRGYKAEDNVVPDVAMGLRFGLAESGESSKLYKFNCLPVSASTSQSSALSGMSCAQAYTGQIIAASEFGVYTSNPAWMDGSAIAERISTRPIIDTMPRPMPWILR